jgi:hypothetical protein
MVLHFKAERLRLEDVQRITIKTRAHMFAALRYLFEYACLRMPQIPRWKIERIIKHRKRRFANIKFSHRCQSTQGGGSTLEGVVRTDCSGHRAAPAMLPVRSFCVHDYRFLICLIYPFSNWLNDRKRIIRPAMPVSFSTQALQVVPNSCSNCVTVRPSCRSNRHKIHRVMQAESILEWSARDACILIRNVNRHACNELPRRCPASAFWWWMAIRNIHAIYAALQDHGAARACNKSMREKYLALGADDNPVKPVTNAELLHALTLCLGQKSP